MVGKLSNDFCSRQICATNNQSILTICVLNFCWLKFTRVSSVVRRSSLRSTLISHGIGVMVRQRYVASSRCSYIRARSFGSISHDGNLSRRLVASATLSPSREVEHISLHVQNLSRPLSSPTGACDDWYCGSRIVRAHSVVRVEWMLNIHVLWRR